MKIASLKAILWLAAGLAASHAAHADAGRTTGFADVSSKGAATYRLPIWAPPGPNGLTPRVSLDYNSQKGNGVVGVGWSIGGISEIERCGQTVGQDGAAREVKLDMEDRFCLDGVRLRLTSPGIGYGLLNSTYQTEIADFSEIRVAGSMIGGGVGPLGFVRRTKEGLTYHYNYLDSTFSGNSRGITAPETALTPHRWKIDRVTDRYGNAYAIQYTEQNSVGHKNPWRIHWGPTASGSPTYTYRMDFEYEIRENQDSSGGYVAGFNTYDRNRLKTIRVFRVNGGTETVLRRYSLEYPATGFVRLSRLTKVTECADDTNEHCLAPTVFDYQNGLGGSTPGSTPVAAGIQGSGDFNGDGKEDIAFIANGQWKVLFGTQGTAAAPVSVTGLIAPTGTVEIDRFLPNGRSAFLANVSGTLTTYSATDANSDGVWEFNGGVSTGIASPIGDAPQAYDFNGDGKADLAWTVFNGSSGGGSTIRQVRGRLNTTATGSASATFGPEIAGTNLPDTPPSGGVVAGLTMWTRNSNHRDLGHPDINGDGREDFFVLLVGRNGTTISYFNVPIQSPTEWGPTNSWTDGFIPNINIGDFNGDGCTDVYNGLVALARCAVLIPTQLNLPAGVTTNVSSTNIMGWGDWTGDGRSDLFIKNGANLGVYPSTGTGFGALLTTNIPSGTGNYFSPGYYFLDFDGDSIVDLARANGSSIDYYTHTAAPGGSTLYATHIANLMASATDGNGVVTYFDYATTAQNSYLPSSTQTAPLQPMAEAKIVVARKRQSNGVGGTSSKTYSYVGGWDDPTRGGFVGFEQVDVLDSVTNFTTKTYYEVAMPKTGMVAKREILQSNGRPVSRVTFTNSPQELSGGSLTSRRYFQFIEQILEETFDLAGPVSGATPITTSLIVNSDVNYAYGNIGKAVRTLTDGDSSATSLDAGKSITTTTTNSFAPVNTGNWCVGLVTRSYVAIASPGETPVTTIRNYTPDVTNCRHSHATIETPNGKYDLVTAFGYDAFGNVQTTTETGKRSNGSAMPDRITRFTWNSTGTAPETIMNAEQETLTFHYNDSGLLDWSKDANQLTTNYVYDKFGRQEKITRPDGTATEFKYADCAPECLANSEHRTTLTTNEINAGSTTPRVSALTYLDRFDRPLVRRIKLIDGKEQWGETKFDDRLRIEKQSLPCQTTSATSSCVAAWVEFEFDDYGRIIESKRPPSGPGSSPTHVYTYSGRTTTIRDPLLKTRSVINGLLGQVRRSTDANSYSQTFTYDLAGSLTGVTDSSGRNLFGATYAYGRGVLQLSRSNLSAGTVAQDFNSFAEMTSWRDARGTDFTADYDDVSRLTTLSETDNTITFEYGTAVADHNVGFLTKASSTAGGAYSKTNYYDSLGRLRYQDYAIPGDATYRYEHTYDPATGFTDTLTYPASTGTRLAIKYGYSNDALSSIGIAGTSQVVWSGITGNIRGQLTEERLGTNMYPGGAIQRSRTFDPVTSWADTSRAGTASVTNAFEDGRVYFDEVGNAIQRQNSKTLISENFIYGTSTDHLYRLDHSELVGGSTPGTNLSLTYDDIGNILTRSQPLITDPLLAYTITWNRANFPTRIEAGSDITQISYGPQRERWKTVFTSNNVDETTINIGGLMEKVTEGGVTTYRHYVQAPTGAAALLSRTSTADKWRYLLPDHLGSVNTIIDGDGGTALATSFGAFGTRRNAATWNGDLTSGERAALEDISRAGFTSQTMLGNVGLIHMNGRVYDAISMRFLSPDPLVSDETNTQNFSRYSYVLNNPLSYTDPSGFEPDGGGSNIPPDDSCPWWQVRNNGVCINVHLNSPQFNPIGMPLSYDWHGPKNIGGTSDSTNSTSLWVIPQRMAHYAGEMIKGAVDSMLRSSWEGPQFDNLGNALPSLEEQFGVPYESAFDPPADSEDQLMRDLGPAAAVVASVATGRLMPGGAVPSVERAAASTAQREVGRVATRINVANGPTRTTPLRANGEPVSAGWEHTVQGHFDRPVANNRSIFSVSQTELKQILQSERVVKSPVTALGDGQFLRTVDVGRTIGTSSLNNGGGPTSLIKVFTDEAGNLISTYPH